MTIALLIVTVIATVVIASMIRLWPYRLDLTLKHYNIDLAGGYAPLWTSIWISVLAAVIGTLLLFLLTFGIRRQPGKSADFAALLSALPVGVPGQRARAVVCVHVQHHRSSVGDVIWLGDSGGAV